MFTGIVEEIGKVATIRVRDKSFHLEVTGKLVLEDLRVGHSVAVNGVCLTATEVKKDLFAADGTPETFRRTNLGKLRLGDRVNLERALRLGDRLGGHLVTGHVDGLGTVKGVSLEGNARRIVLEAPAEICRATVDKGSLAVDGVSLTVAGLGAERIELVLIPHSASATTLGDKVVGDTVNLEVDLIGKYVREGREKGISRAFLAQNGFI